MNPETLSEKIYLSGYKLSYMAKQLDISYMSLNNKLSGKSDFKVSEMRKICEILKLSLEEREKFFGV